MRAKYTKCITEHVFIYITINEALNIIIMWSLGVSLANSIMIMIMKSVFVLSVLCSLSCDSAMVIRSETKAVNERPIIGILSQEQAYELKDEYSKENFTSYIAASYVKSVEAAGARVVPILIGKSRSYYKDLLGKINGVLFPGGATWFNQSNGYADAGQHIYEIAQELNDAGDYFPVFGTCLGFELLVILASGRVEPENRVTCRAYGNFPIHFTGDFRTSKMFSYISDEAVEVLENEDATANVHQFCIVDENMKRHNLTKDWRVTSYSNDENGLRYISSIEHRRHPFYGVQFHPEKPAYEWKLSKHYAHSSNVITANRHFMDFFVGECKKNHHSFGNEDEENEYLIYNFRPYFTGAHASSYTQCYFFEPKGILE